MLQVFISLKDLFGQVKYVIILSNSTPVYWYSGKRRLKNLNITNNLLGVHSKHRTSFKKIHFPFSTMALAVVSGLKIAFSILN